MADSKMTEIAQFLQNEQEELSSSKRAAIVDYEATKKLIQTLRTSHRELNQEHAIIMGRKASIEDSFTPLAARLQEFASKLLYTK